MRRLALCLILAGALTAGCSGTTQDLEDVDAIHPDKVEVYQAPDQFANVERLCIDGVAFAGTTRAYTSLVRIPEWDDWCGGVGK